MPVLPGPDSPTPGQGYVQPWATVADVCAPCNDYGFDETVLENGLQMASEILYELTGKRWPGEVTDTIRPCGINTSVSWGLRYVPSIGLEAAERLLTGWCGCFSTRNCGCSHVSEIKLPGYPVTGVNYVKIDGQILDPARYRIDDHRWLVYLPDDGRNGWPCCQDMTAADTEPDTWSVSYTYGRLPDQGGVNAAASLGCQLALACTPGDTTCRLPKRVTTITRQGVSTAILDPLTLFRDGQTGLPEVDLWIASKLIGASRRRATAHRIGSKRVRRTNS